MTLTIVLVPHPHVRVDAILGYAPADEDEEGCVD
jgi:hypothetical protein